MTHSHSIEEQSVPFYHRKRYRIITKLGYGAYSTVWLALTKYVSLKVSVQADRSYGKNSHVFNELSMLRRLERFANEDHQGLDFTRLARDIFEIESLGGLHYCIVFQPQGNSVRALQETFHNAKIPKFLLKSLIHRLFFSVNWLHATCGVAHTDISPPNVLMEIQDDTSLKDIEDQETRCPSLAILSTVNSTPTVVYRSKPTILEVTGNPILTDFGQMRLIEDCVNRDWWISDLYRAPKTLELLEGKNLLDQIDHAHAQYVLPRTLAQYRRFPGPPPSHIIQQTPLFPRYFDTKGKWISECPIPKTFLEDFVMTIPPGEEKDRFLKFTRKIFTWDPDVRATANEFIPDEWLMRPYEDML
ncbi:hypothetical protein N7488_010785 [Penicillium malachiteum]|nr:hypothetical protein N7488_010785 [Penicillium malachiteum]